MGSKRKVEVVTPVPVRDWQEFEFLVEVGFGEMIERRQEWDKQQKEAEAKIDDINVDIQAYLIALEQKSVKVGKWITLVANGRSGSTLSPQKLMEKGVDPDIISECWVAGTPYTYAQVVDTEKPRKGKKGKTNDEDRD